MAEQFQIFVLVTARKRSLGQGNIFAPVCHSVHRGCVWYPSMHCRWYPSMPCSRSPGEWYPSMPCRSPGGSPGPNLGGSPGPRPGGGSVSSMHWGRPPVDGYCRGRYASYWNAFLLYFKTELIPWNPRLTMLWMAISFCDCCVRMCSVEFSPFSMKYGFLEKQAHFRMLIEYCITSQISFVRGEQIQLIKVSASRTTYYIFRSPKWNLN